MTIQPRQRIETYEVIRETWLTRKPRPEAALVASGMTLLLALVAALFLAGPANIRELMAASPRSVFEHGQYWRLWTTLFAHGDPGHLVSNSFLFFILGFFLYGYFGWRMFPWAAFLWGGIANWFVLQTYGKDVQLIGASGVVYWMGGTWLVLYFYLSRQKNLMHRWLRTLGVAILIFMPAETFEPSTSYRTHFVGFVLGLAAGGWHFYLHRRRFRRAEVKELIVEEDDMPDEFGPVQSST